MTSLEELNHKIDVLTNLVLTLQETIHHQNIKLTKQTKQCVKKIEQMEKPKISLETWLQNTQMADVYINTLFEDGSVNAFQKFITDHNEKTNLPVLHKDNNVYICNHEEWQLYDENIIKYMIETIWKKFLNYYLNIYVETETDEQIKDKKKGVVLKMRQNLYDIKKNKELLSRWLRKF